MKVVSVKQKAMICDSVLVVSVKQKTMINFVIQF